MEVGLPRGTALVFGLRDGSASLYLSSGGGALGGQGRPEINAAAKKLVETARGLGAKLSPADEHPLPPVGQVRFSIFTPAGGFRRLDEGRRPSAPLYLNCLPTALARGSAPSVALTAGTPPPDPASRAAGFRWFTFGKTQGTLRTMLPAHDGKSSSICNFRVSRRSTNGRLQLEIALFR